MQQNNNCGENNIFTQSNIDYSWQLDDNKTQHMKELCLPIFGINKNNISLSICEEKYWILEIEKVIIPLNNSDLRCLLPLLQMPYTQFTLLVEQGLSKYNLPVSLINNLPIQNLILLALRSQSDFWINQALEWLQHLQIDREIILELDRMIKEKSRSQDNRTRGKKILKQLRSNDL